MVQKRQTKPSAGRPRRATVSWTPRRVRNLPLVVFAHGGPWARNAWGYNGDVQFLANRGYAVLQMNFRGSTGYGRAFWEAGFKQWGRKMQDDVTDGVRYVIAQGIADPKRIDFNRAGAGAASPPPEQPIQEPAVEPVIGLRPHIGVGRNRRGGRGGRQPIGRREAIRRGDRGP
jgi:hypothetical protein